MSSTEKVKRVAAVRDEYSLTVALAAVELPKSTWYYHQNQKLIKAIDTKNHTLIEQELDNIRRGWEWVSHDSKDLGLVVAYGGLAWRLFDITTSRLHEALREFEKLHLSEHDKVIINSPYADENLTRQ